MVVETQNHMLTVTLTDEEHALLALFAAEQGIDDLGAAVPAMIHQLVRLHDLLWDRQLTTLPAPLTALGQAALDAYEAGQTEDFDIESP